MKLPVDKGADTPVVFLELLLLFITGYVGLMFYLEENFIPAIVSFGLAVTIIRIMLDLSFL